VASPPDSRAKLFAYFFLERNYMKISVSLRLTTTLLLLPLAGLGQSPHAGMSQRTAARILEQATWGPTTGAIQALQTEGFDIWFDAQVNAPKSTIPSQPLLNSDGSTNSNIAPLQVNFFQNALTGKDQLRQRVAFALSEIWVVSNLDLNNASAFPPILRLFQGDAFGSYLTLMHDISISPAMGHYLDMANNAKANLKTGTAANENYARELMQLFTLGLYELNKNGTPVMKSGEPVSSYTQDTVTNMAKVCTGWTYAPMPGATSRSNNPQYFLLPMVAVEALHDTTAKSIFGKTLPAGNSALTDLDDALQIIFDQPTLAPFISKQLIQHLVTSNPSDAYVERVANVFETDSKGRHGYLESVIYQILTDPEARAGDSEPPSADFGHLREPVLFVANLLRGLNGNVTATSVVQNYSNSAGQNLFNPASVFSYFPPSYTTDGANPILAPEMAEYSTQTSVARTGLINSAIYGGKFDAGTTFDLTPFITAAGSTNQTQFFSLVDLTFFHQTLSSTTKAAMQTAMAAVTAPADKAKAGLYIALTSSEFQVIH
jgi:uncharacterized protein (DUF1800 family)